MKAVILTSRLIEGVSRRFTGRPPEGRTTRRQGCSGCCVSAIPFKVVPKVLRAMADG